MIESLETRLVLASATSTVLPTSSLVTGSMSPSAAVISAPVTATAFAAQPTFVLRDPIGGAQPLSTSAPSGFTPSQVRQAYGLNQVLFGSVTGDGTGQTIAIIDAYNDPNIVSDLAGFDSQFGLAGTTNTQVNSFLKVVNESGGSKLPANAPNPGDSWALEISLDVEWAHAIAPGAHLLLVECNSSSFSDLVHNSSPSLKGGVDYARSVAGVSAVTMSFGGSEDPTETGLDQYFTTPAGHAGVTFLASTGDAAQPAEFPALSPNVVAVGGTNLVLADNAGTYSSESAWSSGGGGVSTFEPQPGYQNNVVTQNSVFRTGPDVAFDADPQSGVAVYDSYDGSASSPWIQVGGTSLSSPAWAGLIAIANQGRSLNGLASLDGPTETLPRLYNLPSSDFHDVTSGNNGFAAGNQYDVTTGRGTPFANLLIPDLTHASPGPHVTSSSPLGTQAGPVSSVSFNFDQAMDPTSFATAGGVARFTGPGNVDLLSTLSSYAWSNGNKTLQVYFNGVTTNGNYALVLASAVKNASGVRLDQNYNGTAGEASDTYTATFAIANAVGPDSYGYTASSYPFENLGLTSGAAGVTSVLANADDDSAALDLGTNTFNFYGQTYTGTSSLFADMNGFITLGSGASVDTEFNNADLSSDLPQATIAPLWDDWSSIHASGESVLYELRNPNASGIPQQLVIEWHAVENQGISNFSASGTSPEATFQAILQLNTGSTPGTIIFNYPNLALGDPNFTNGASSTVGIKNAGTQGNQSLLVSLDNPSNPLIASGTAVRISTLPLTSAKFVKSDTVTAGNWQGVYGSQGYNLAGYTNALPANVTFSTDANAPYEWTGSTNDPRALQQPAGGRAAAAWWSGSTFNMNVNLTDGKTHQVSLYLVDYDTSNARSEQVDVLDSDTGKVLTSQLVGDFSSGRYLVFNVQGNVTFRLTNLGTNAVVSGLFLDPVSNTATAAATATFLSADASTQGTWKPIYGTQGYALAGDANTLPASTIFATDANSPYVWAASTEDTRALEVSGRTGREAAAWWSPSAFNINLNLTDGNLHQVGLYALDFDTANGRTERIDVLDSQSGQVLATQTINNFSGGRYLLFNVKGDVTFRVTSLTGNAVLSGLFVDPAGTIAGPATATYIKADAATAGNWNGSYGAQGYTLAGDANTLPANTIFSTTANGPYVWAASTSDSRALMQSAGASRTAAAWWSPTSFDIQLNVTDGVMHQVALYALDYDTLNGRSERIDVLDTASGQTLTSETINNFSAGRYLVFNVKGNVTFRVTSLSGNAVLSGLFIDPADATAESAVATSLVADSTTSGAWKNDYGTQGANIAGDASTLPVNTIFSTTANGPYVWAASTSDARALQNVTGSGRQAAAWWSPTSFDIHLDVTDGLMHQVALYALDFDTNNTRSERIDVLDTRSGQVLATQTVSSFSAGRYILFNVTGDVTIRVTSLSGNAVLSGLFIDPAAT